MYSKRKIFATAFAAAAFAASAVYAADTPATGGGWRDCQNGGPSAGYGPGAGHGPGMMSQGSGRGMMGHSHGGFGAGNPAAMVAGHLAALKVELKITREQEGAWEKFAAKAGKQAETMTAQREQMFADRSSKEVPAPERLAKRTEIARQHIANMESMTAAVKDLYGVLAPEQKKIADELLARGPMGGMGGGHGFRR